MSRRWLPYVVGVTALLCTLGCGKKSNTPGFYDVPLIPSQTPRSHHQYHLVEPRTGQESYTFSILHRYPTGKQEKKKNKATGKKEEHAVMDSVRVEWTDLTPEMLDRLERYIACHSPRAYISSDYVSALHRSGESGIRVVTDRYGITKVIVDGLSPAVQLAEVSEWRVPEGTVKTGSIGDCTITPPQ